MRRTILRLVAVALLLAGVGQAKADYIFVGSWEVDQGPPWPTVPAIYTGQDAAALLFGGNPSDYAISTVDANPANINFEAWYSPWGGSSPGYTGQPNGDGNLPVGIMASQSAFVDYGGTGHYDTPGDLSSYVQDWAIGPFYTNYAFVNQPAAAAPEPASLTLLGFGAAGLLGYGWRRRKPAQA